MSAELTMAPTELDLEVAATVRAFLAGRCGTDVVAARYEGDDDPARKLWRSVNEELGLGAMLLPESLGGSGLGPRAAGLVATELGRVVSPVPFLSSAVVAATVATETGSTAIADALVDGRTVVLAQPMDVLPGDAIVAVDAQERVAGTVRDVLDAEWADALLVPTLRGGVPELQLVEAGSFSVERGNRLDMARQFADVRIDAPVGDPVATGDEVERVLRHAGLVSATMLAAEQLGAARWCFDAAREHLLTRRQFGRLLGSFQALKHEMAELFVKLDAMETVARYGVAVIESGDADELRIAARMAQATASDHAVAVAETALQLHGGLGMTWELPLHFRLKRVKSAQVTWGTAEQHRSALADLLGL